jgi:hypothetical protein|tara:strand:- start:236 stop:565 length:330 start_codon:yes stop_codon:yes gene_type:complete
MADNQFPVVPISIPDHSLHLRLVSNSLNNTINGKLNSTGSLTLTASATTTTLTDERIGGNSVILFMPTTANANTAKANLYVSARGEKTATLTHASSGNTDQTFGYVVIG